MSGLSSGLACLALVLALVASLPSLVRAGSGMRVDIDEETWPEVLSGGGRWFIKFYAPWCEACANLAPAWQSLAASEGLPRDANIGQVDVTRNEALAGMFMVTGLPSLYLLHDGNFWQYRGDRTLPALLQYVQQAEYTRQPPLPWYRKPDALHMRALGRLIQAAVRLKQVHTHLVEARGLPSPAAYAVLAVVTLVGGLLAGLALVCLCDLALGARRRRLPSGAAAVGAAGDVSAADTSADDEGDKDGGDSEDLRTAEGAGLEAAPTADAAEAAAEHPVRKRAGARKEAAS